MRKLYTFFVNTQALHTKKYDTRPTFKQSFNCLERRVLLLQFRCRIKGWELFLPNYLPIDRGRLIGITSFPKVLDYVKCKRYRPGFELSSQCPFPMTATITPRKHLVVMLQILISTKSIVTTSLQLLPDPLWLSVIVSVRILLIGKMYLSKNN